jgi:nucleotide-binding universal stress UspA family protein
MSRKASATRTITLQRAFRKIMVAVDAPETSGKALELAVKLAATNHAELVVAHVEPVYLPVMAPFGFGTPITLSEHVSEIEVEERRRSSRWLSRLVGVAEERGISATSVLVPGQLSVAEELVRIASDAGADLIVTGTNDRSPLERFVLGSTSGTLLKLARCPVLVAR